MDSCTPQKCGRGLRNLFEQGNQCVLSGRCDRAIYTLILKTFPQNVYAVGDNKLKMAKFRYYVTHSKKIIFDLINRGQALAVSVHRNYYTYL